MLLVLLGIIFISLYHWEVTLTLYLCVSIFSLYCHAFLCQPEDEMVQTCDFSKNRIYVMN